MRSHVGVGTGPPKVPKEPNPTSSKRTTTTFGASFGPEEIGKGSPVESLNNRFIS
ncbi:MAG: Uncharacterised protein [Acidimicrobiales bacterium AG-410-I20]|nr:MAG: Uncharacterised protein [Acidimicrobiales bacterium AG-410-I20]